jgi:ribonuclease BN (tRNA processing enzyme)
VEHDGYRLVLDLGAGALGQLQRHIGLLDVDAVYVSHLHADHCIDLVAYSYARRFHPDGVPPRLPVYGPAGTAQRICSAFEEPPELGLLDVYDFREVEAGSCSSAPSR